MSAGAQRFRDSVVARLGHALAARGALVRPASPADEQVLRDSITVAARAQIGARYRLGAESPTRGFDCSGLVRFVLGMLRIDMPRTARNQATAGEPLARDPTQLLPGDLLTFGSGRRVTHVGIYVGDGRFIHASTSKRRVVESSLVQKGSWFARHWVGARRVVVAADNGVRHH